VDELATAYPGTPTGELLGRVRAYLGYVGTLLDGRTTLAEHRRLLVVGGWLSLLAATTLIDLHHDHAAAHLRTAAQLARETEHAEIAAWCLETQAWQGADPGRLPPRGRDLPAHRPEVRHILTRLESATDGPPRPRRAASARLDLSLALIASGRHDEAAGTALEAINSGRIVPSNYWRAREIIHAVAERGVPEAADLTEAYREACHDGERPALRLVVDLLLGVPDGDLGFGYAAAAGQPPVAVAPAGLGAASVPPVPAFFDQLTKGRRPVRSGGSRLTGRSTPA
jgi:hypothetical protein